MNEYEEKEERMILVNPGSSAPAIAAAVDPLMPPRMSPFEFRSALVMEEQPEFAVKGESDFEAPLTALPSVGENTLVVFSLDSKNRIIATAYGGLHRQDAVGHALRLVLLSGGNAIALACVHTQQDDRDTFVAVAQKVKSACEVITIRFLDALTVSDDTSGSSSMWSMLYKLR